MKLIISLIILSPFVAFGQWTNNIVPGGEEFADASWNDYGLEVGDIQEQSTVTVKFGTYSRHINCDAANEGALGVDFSVTSGQIYRCTAWIYNVTGVGWVVRNAGRVDFQVISNGTGSWTKYSSTKTATSTGLERLRLNTRSAAAESYFDNVFIRQAIDTLRISGSGADTDNDTCKTATEAFIYRGAHSGGVFEFLGGSFNENITIDSSFSNLYASTATTINQIDFNNVTATVDLANLVITTKLNDTNITYINIPSTLDTKLSFPKKQKKLHKMEKQQ